MNTKMLELNSTDKDDSHFIEIVSRISNNLVRCSKPAEIYLIQIDSFFDYKWESFSGKVLGALPVWKLNLTVPPFVPNRIVNQRYFKSIGSSYALKWAKPLHIHQSSSSNMTRFIKRLIKSGMVIWYSGNTNATRLGSLMVYEIERGDVYSFYISFKKQNEWDIEKVSGIGKQIVSSMIQQNENPRCEVR